MSKDTSLADHRSWLQSASLDEIKADVIDSATCGSGAEGWERQGIREWVNRTGTPFPMPAHLTPARPKRRPLVRST